MQRIILLVVLCFLIPACMKKSTRKKVKALPNCVEYIELCKKSPLDDLSHQVAILPSEQNEFSKVPSVSISKNYSPVKPYDISLAELQARLVDIPLACNARLQHAQIDYEHGYEQIMIQYDVSMQLRQIVDFYHQSMERLGWQELANYNNTSACLVFCKVNKFCSIIIQSAGQYNSKQDTADLQIIIFSGKLQK